MPAILFNTILEQQAKAPFNTQQSSVNSTEETPTFRIEKTEDDKKYVFGWASIAITADGEQLEDLQRDIIDPEDLEESVYNYVLNFRDGGEEHIPTLRKKASLIESVMFTKEKMAAMGIPEGIVPEGWWIGFYVKDDDAWAKIKNGTYKMFSIEGKAIREDVEDDIGKADRINGCGVIVIQDDKILCGTRVGGKHNGQTGGPGGHIERGETPEEAAIRETYEEFGIICRDLIPLGLQDSGRNYGKSQVFLCTNFIGKPHADEDEMVNAHWATIDELMEDPKLYKPFELSLELVTEEVEEDEEEEETPENTAKSFSSIIAKFNPFHDARGRFSNKGGFATYSANPKTKAGAMAIARSAQAGHGKTFNSHKESKGENIDQNFKWLNGGPGAKALAAQGQLANQKPKATAQPKGQKDANGFSNYDSADYHQLYNGRGYYQQQNLSKTTKQACDRYLNPNTEAGSLYNFSQNMNQAMKDGTLNQPRNARYKAVYDELVSKMHNIGYNVNLTRYDHGGFLDEQLAQVGITNRRNMSVDQLKSALVGHKYADNRILSTSYNDFKNATNHSVFTSREIKITYKAKASTQALMPGNGPGGKFGEMLLGPTNGKSNTYKIVDVKPTGKMARKKGTQNFSLQQIELVVEVE